MILERKTYTQRFSVLMVVFTWSASNEAKNRQQ